MRLRPLLSILRPPAVLQHRGGRYYLGQSHVTQSSVYTLVQDTLVGQPFFVPSWHTYDRIAVNVETVQSGRSVRLGIYSHDYDNAVPGALALDAGTVSLTAAGKQELTISQGLCPGWYWLGCLSDATGTARLVGARNTNAGNPLLGYDDADSTDFHRYVTRPVTFGSLPDPFGTIGSYATDELPRVWLRA